MNTLKNVLAIILIATIFTSCKNDTKPEVVEVETTTQIAKKELDPNGTYAKAEFTIDGMTCAIGCAKTIEKKIAKMDGVKSATVDFDRRLAMVEYDEALVNHTSLEETVNTVADTYKVSDIKAVDAFSTKSKECSTKCSEDCTEKDCAKCAAKKEECKKACDAKKAECKAGDKKECTVKCSEDCTEKDCAKCAEKSAECKKKCDAKKAEANQGDKKMACADGCKKECCAGKKTKA